MDDATHPHPKIWHLITLGGETMRAYKIVALFSVIALNAVDAVAQSAEFKCPAPGTVVEFSNGAKEVWVSQDGNTCRIQSTPPNGQGLDLIWYAPSARDLVSSNNPKARQMKASNLWPLAVGKKMQARNDGPSHDGTFNASWITTLTVEKAEKITTKAGTFDTFVVVLKVEGLSTDFIRYTRRSWYAPEPGVVVKWDYSDNRAQKLSAEATVIRRVD